MEEYEYSELGALLIAVGTEMALREVCADAAVSGDADDVLIATMMKHGIDGWRAKKLLELDLAMVVSYIKW